MYKFLGNQDSLENIDFFFEFIDEVTKEGARPLLGVLAQAQMPIRRIGRFERVELDEMNIPSEFRGNRVTHNG